MLRPQFDDAVTVILITHSVNGTPEQRLAAKMLLDCINRSRSRKEIAAFLEKMEEDAILDVAQEARRLARHLSLI